MNRMRAPTITPGSSESGRLPPHPPIVECYTDPEQKHSFVTALFDDTAVDYETVERWLSLGSGRWYRGQALRRAGLRPGMHMVDVALGTGLVAGEALAIVGPLGKVVGIDPSREMLQLAKNRFGIETVVGTAEALPFESETFDFLSMGYALRHVDDLTTVFREFFRVLRSGGRACVLEITRPRTAIGRAALRAYFGALTTCLCRLKGLSPRTPELWKYYWKTIDQCVPPQRVMDALIDVGFVDVNRRVSCALCSEYAATKP
jgi:demethylmenaquinone methyltransferase / 2-methoxy-6-polyprenyl-1,4-benzoquinol methylase